MILLMIYQLRVKQKQSILNELRKFIWQKLKRPQRDFLQIWKKNPQLILQTLSKINNFNLCDRFETMMPNVSFAILEIMRKKIRLYFAIFVESVFINAAMESILYPMENGIASPVQLWAEKNHEIWNVLSAHDLEELWDRPICRVRIQYLLSMRLLIQIAKFRLKRHKTSLIRESPKLLIKHRFLNLMWKVYHFRVWWTKNWEI